MTTQQETAQAKLLFAINHPNYDDVWLEGYEESLADIEENANPYPKDSTEYHYWSEGWWAASYGEEPLFDYEGQVIGSAETAATVEATPEKSTRILTLGRIFSGVLLSSAVAAVSMDFII